MGSKRIPGEWICIEEWGCVDLLAVSAWSKGHRIAYEIKVSRADLRRELLEPSKRALAVAISRQFYLAVPQGLLTWDEKSWQEPEWNAEDFKKSPCSNPSCSHSRPSHPRSRRYGRSPRGKTHAGKSTEGVTVHVEYFVDRGQHDDGSTFSHSYNISACCTVCKGRPTSGKSRVETEAPNVWVPRDCGLIEVAENGSSTIVKKAPITDQQPLVNNEYALHQLLRWVSFRPDPRHHEPQGED